LTTQDTIHLKRHLHKPWCKRLKMPCKQPAEHSPSPFEMSPCPSDFKSI
jgi:hypothetical protein